MKRILNKKLLVIPLVSVLLFSLVFLIKWIVEKFEKSNGLNNKNTTGSSSVERVIVSSVGASLPQDIATSATPEFNGLNLTGDLSLSAININTKRVADTSELTSILNSNNYTGLVLVNTDTNNSNNPGLYFVYGNASYELLLL